MLIEENFAGSFDGGISQFRMYVTPLSAPEVKHNFLLLKDKFDMFNPDCPNCNPVIVCLPNDFTYSYTATPITVTIETTIGPGSIVLDYTSLSAKLVNGSYTLSFTNILEYKDNTKIGRAHV